MLRNIRYGVAAAILLCLTVTPTGAATPTLEVLAVTGDPAPGGGVFTSFGAQPLLTNSSQVLLVADVELDDGTAEQVIATGGVSGFELVARTGEPVPAGDAVYNQFFDSNTSISNSGQISFLSSVLTGGTATPALFQTTSTGIKELARNGEFMRTEEGYSSLQRNVMNEAGQIAVLTQWISTVGDDTLSQTLYLFTDGKPTPLLTTGEPTPSGDTSIRTLSGTSFSINNAGEIAISPSINDPSGSPQPLRSLMIVSESGVVERARTGVIPEGGDGGIRISPLHRYLTTAW